MIMCQLPADPKQIPPDPSTSDQPTGAGTTPGARVQAMNILAPGPDLQRCFYITGTVVQESNGRKVRDLWVLNCQTVTWTQLASPPAMSLAPVLVYDSLRNQLLLQVDAQIYAYTIASNTWHDVTPLGGTGYPPTYQTVGAYIPSSDMFIMQGGLLTGSPGNNAGAGMRAFTQAGGTTPVTTATINVTSTPPGAAIQVSPVDNNGDGNCPATPCTRIYTIADAKVVTLIAPATLSGDAFSDWAGPCDTEVTITCTVLASSTKFLNAVYPGTPATRTLTITTIPAGIPMTLSSGSCPATPCSPTYADGTVVTITAPLTHLGASYTIWTGCNSMTGRICSMTMNANKGASVPYVSGTTYQHSIDFSNEQGSRGWRTYELAGSLLTPMTFANGRWGCPEPACLIMPGGLSHPGTTRFSVLEWTSPVLENLRITGSVIDGDPGGGDGVDVSITRDGVVLFSATLANGGAAIPFNFMTSAVPGTVYRFITSPRGNNNNDTTIFDPVIAPFAVVPTSSLKFGDSIMRFGPNLTFGE
jgi:hypothetical protein